MLKGDDFYLHAFLILSESSAKLYPISQIYLETFVSRSHNIIHNIINI